jgi:hypothetical protein
VALGLAAAVSAVAHPPALVGRDGRPLRGEMHRWVHQSRAPLPSGRVKIVRIRCPARPKFVACVYSRRPSRIYMRPRVRNPRWVLYHELGHVFDFRVMNQRERRAFRKIMRLRGRRWYVGDDPPAELFAEGYANCAAYGPAGRPRRKSVYGYRPSAAQHRAVCRLLASAAAPRGRRPQPPPKPPKVIETPPAPPPGQPPQAPPRPEPPPTDDDPGPLDVIFEPLPGR